MQQTALQASYKAFTDMQGLSLFSSTNKLALKHIMKLGMFCLPALGSPERAFFCYFVLLVSKDAI